MTRKELKKQIRAKHSEMRELQSKSVRSNDLDELKSINESLEKIRKDIDELEELIDELDNQEDADNESRSFNPLETMGMGNGVRSNNGMRTLASFGSGTNSADGLALRANESMVSRVAPNGKVNLDIGKYIRGAVTGQWDGAAEERAAFTTTSTGVVIPSVLSAEIIDGARDVSLFTSAGVKVIPMREGNMTIARVKKDPEFQFKSEGEEQSEGNEFELDDVQLKAKTAYGYAYVSLEAIHSARNIRDIINKTFSQAMADCIDKGMLYGQTNNPTSAPSGIMNDPDINVITAENKGYTDFVKAIGAVRRANGTPTVLGINADTEEIFSLMVDNNGQPLTPPKALDDMKKVVSNQLKSDETEGSDALVFDPNAMVIGVQNNVVLRMFQDTDYCIKNGMVGFQIYCMIDSVAVRPNHIAKINGIKNVD